MNQRHSFRRKLIYLGLACLLLFPIYMFSRPATKTDPSGGILAKSRLESGLSEANLGKIDPASATMKLATLGMNSIAQNILWNKADEYKKKEDWTKLTATLETLAKLNPNMISLWKFQSWNLSYNVSVQFDDYRDRYYYVRRGIDYLEEGIEYNRENRDIPQLLWDLGWFVGQKVGRADEYVQYRRLFRADDDYHGDERPVGSDQRDNWLVSKTEYQNAIDAIARGKSIGKKSEKIVYSSPAKSQMNYAEAIEEEGFFEKGQQAWGVAAADWQEFGDRVIEHSTGRRLRLGHEASLADEVESLEAQLDALDPGVRERIREEKAAALPEAARFALNKAPDERSSTEAEVAYNAEQSLSVTDQEVFERIVSKHPEKRKEAGVLVARLSERRMDYTYTQRYKRDANFDYWQLRAEFEQTDIAVAAREKMFQAKQARDNQDDQVAVQLYEEGFELWKEVLDRFPDLRDPEGTTGDDLIVYIKEYRDTLRVADQQIPDDFPLWDIIENFDSEQEFVEDLQEYRSRAPQRSVTNGDNPADGRDAPPSEAAEDADEATGTTTSADPPATTEEGEEEEVPPAGDRSPDAPAPTEEPEPEVPADE